MPRPSHEPTTALGQALRTKRGERRVYAVAKEIGIAQSTLTRIEQGDGAPSATTALRLARWLDWSMEDVLLAALEDVQVEE